MIRHGQGIWAGKSQLLQHLHVPISLLSITSTTNTTNTKTHLVLSFRQFIGSDIQACRPPEKHLLHSPYHHIPPHPPSSSTPHHTIPPTTSQQMRQTRPTLPVCLPVCAASAHLTSLARPPPAKKLPPPLSILWSVSRPSSPPPIFPRRRPPCPQSYLSPLIHPERPHRYGLQPTRARHAHPLVAKWVAALPKKYHPTLHVNANAAPSRLYPVLYP